MFYYRQQKNLIKPVENKPTKITPSYPKEWAESFKRRLKIMNIPEKEQEKLTIFVWNNYPEKIKKKLSTRYNPERILKRQQKKNEKIEIKTEEKIENEKKEVNNENNQIE